MIVILHYANMKLKFNTIPDATYKVIFEPHINVIYTTNGYISDHSVVVSERFLFLILQSLSVRCEERGIIHEHRPPLFAGVEL